VAFASSPAPPPKTALFANDPSCNKAGITFSGSSDTVNGYSHSNGAFAVPGSKNTFGPSDSGAPCKPSVTGSGNTFNGAPAPTQDQNNLSFPETYSQSTVCTGATHTGTSITISSGTPSGIYCYTGSITVSVSNVTAKVTFVAPKIVLSGSGLNLSPAYGDLLAYDTDNTLGNSGFTVPGSGVIIAQGTVYAPFAAISLAGSKSSWDGLVEGDTISVSGGFNFTGEGPSPTGLPFTISGDVVGKLYPGGASRPIPVTFTNPNSDPIYVTGFNVSVDQTSLPSGCMASWFTITPSNISATNPVTVPGNGTATLPIGSSVSAPTISMTNSGKQDACQGANLTLDYTLGSAHS
jgi:hypothetical protein